MGLFDLVSGAGNAARHAASNAASATGYAGMVAARTFLRQQLVSYHRLGVAVQAPVPDVPTLYVTNHGFGGSSDIHVYSAVAIIEQLTDKPVRILAHKVLWDVGLGPVIEALGAVQASHEAAHQAFEEGYHILVLPGGDLDAVKPWNERNSMSFHGHAGFVKLARNLKCPVVPIVTAGGAESAVVFTRGQGIAKAIKADKTARLQIMPIILSAPWGVNVLTSAILPYIPMPSKLDSVVMPARDVLDDRPMRDVADEIEADMQAVLADLTEGRIPVLGRVGRDTGQTQKVTTSARPRTPKPPIPTPESEPEATGSGSSAPEPPQS